MSMPGLKRSGGRTGIGDETVRPPGVGCEPDTCREGVLCDRGTLELLLASVKRPAQKKAAAQSELRSRQRQITKITGASQPDAATLE